MCMRNLNTMVFFIKENGDKEEQTLLLDNPIYEVIQANSDAKSVNLSELKLVVGINSIQRKGEPYTEGDFNFAKYYDFLIRLTDVSSGNYVDLYQCVLQPGLEYKDLSRFVYSKSFSVDFKDIDINISTHEHITRDSKNVCVIKILLRESGHDDKQWTVQSIHPFKMEPTLDQKNN